MLKINRVRITEERKLEMSALSDKREELKFELLFEDIPMLIQMLLAAKQQKERKDKDQAGYTPTLLMNYVEGWEVFELPQELPQGIGVHFQCAGGFDFSFAIPEEGGHTPADFMSDLKALTEKLKP